MRRSRHLQGLKQELNEGFQGEEEKVPQTTIAPPQTRKNLKKPNSNYVEPSRSFCFCMLCRGTNSFNCY